MGMFSKPCDHRNVITSFRDLHTGKDGEIYVRSDSRCIDCGVYRPTIAVKLPDVVSKVLHENMDIGTITRKVTDERIRTAQALDVVYDNIDKRAMSSAINAIVHDAMKKAFNEA